MKKFLSFFGRSFLRLSTILGAVMIISGVASCTIGMYAMRHTAPPPLGDTSVLVVRLMPDFNDQTSMSLLDGPFMPRTVTIRDVVGALYAAANDNKIKSVVFSMRGPELHVADVQEMRAGIAAVRAAGKYTMIYAPSIDGLAAYYLASAFDEIWVQPVGTVAMDGLGGDQPYFKRLFDKFGIGASFIQRREFKSAMEHFTATKMSDPARANAATLLNDIADTVLADLARDRKKSVAELRAGMDMGVLTGPEALKAGIIDRLEHPDQLDVAVREKLGVAKDDDDAIDFVSLGDYLALTRPGEDFGALAGIMGAYETDAPPVPPGHKRVAVVTIDGAIYAEHETGGMMSDVGQYTADDWAGSIEDATDDDGIAAIIVRVNSPGGTPSGAEDIRRAIVQARTKGKVVVVSMGIVAASGGYWLAAPADHIFANATTITGSIGVIGGKFDVAGASEKLGITWDGVAVGKNVGLFSPHRGFTPGERARMDAMMDETYGYFKTVVADGRALNRGVVEGLAKGQVYAGTRAKELGLVDTLGGFQDTLSWVAEKVSVADIDHLVVEDWPAPMSPLQELFALLKGQAMVARMGASVARVMDLRPHVGVYVLDRAL
jgi:protease-4